jgi:hypothetical protein
MGDENLKSTNYFLSNGLSTLSSNTSSSKNFAKKLYELICSHYRDKKDSIKRKQRKLVQGQPEHVRFNMKQAIYSLLTTNDISKCMKKLEEAYNQLKSSNYMAAPSR